MSKTKDELLDEAEELGVAADESMTNAEIQAAIDAASSGGGGGSAQSSSDDGGFDTSAYAGVSADRIYKPADDFNLPVTTEWEVASAEAYQAEIDAANEEKEAEREAAAESNEAAARKRLTDFLGS